jgi:ribose transport system substrate-binding protein
MPESTVIGARRAIAAFALAGLVAISLSATGALARGTGCTPHKIDVGNGMSVMGGCGKLKIAYLDAATNNVYLQAGIKGAKDAAKKYGAEVTVFDANWSPTTQYNQTQNAISSGKFDAFIAEMNDGRQSCKILTQDSPKNNVLVSVVNQPLCNRATATGTGLWAPGTLDFVGGTQGREPFRDWIMQIAKQNPGPQKVAVLTGPDLNANTINTDLALKDVQKAYPNFKVVAVVRTDYSVPQGQAKALPLLQANKDLTIVIGNYSDITRGLVSAAQATGLIGKVKIYDSGGNQWAFDAVKKGLITSTRTLQPYTEIYKSVAALAAAWAGKPVPRYQPLVTQFITKANVDKFKPEY